MLFPFDVAPSFVLLGDVLARWSGGLSSPRQPARGRVNGELEPAKQAESGGCSGDLRALHQRIDIISLLYFWPAGYADPEACYSGAQRRRVRRSSRYQRLATNRVGFLYTARRTH